MCNKKPKLSRRDFLKYVSAGTCGAAIHQAISPVGQMMAFADPTRASATTNRVCILVNLSGGASLSLFPQSPEQSPAWFDRMGGSTNGLAYTAVQAGACAIDSRQFLNPGLLDLLPFWQAGEMAIINKVGFPNYTRSHDEDTNIWFRGGNNMGQSGWAALLTNQMSSIFAGISFGGSNLLIQGDGNVPRSFGNLSNFGEDSIGSSTQTRHMKLMRDSAISMTPHLGTGNFAVVKNAMDGISASIAQITAATQRALPNAAEYTNGSGFVTACRDAARLLNAPELGTQFIYLERGGWDTHSGARTTVFNNAQDVANGLSALLNTATLIGRKQDVVIVTMSEFGRTFYNGNAQTAGRGDDHGHSAPMMVLGGPISGRLVNDPPSNAEVAAAPGYIKGYDVVFWAVFKEIIDWMGYDATRIFLTPPPNNTYTNLSLFR